MRLSRDARYALKLFIDNPSIAVNSASLQTHMEVSRRKSRALIAELEAAGYLDRRTNSRYGTRIKLSTRVPKLVPSQSLYSSTASSSISNSVTASTTDIATNKLSDEVRWKEESVGWDFFEPTSTEDDERLRERQKHEAMKKAEYAEEKAKVAQKRSTHRSAINPVHWTVKDVAFEFADRMSNYWNIKPFDIIQSRFVHSLSAFRKKHDTNGAIELVLIDMFFAGLKAEKYQDGNHLWRSFLHYAPSMVQDARMRVITPEQKVANMARAQEQASKKLALLDEED
jgi:hypothetical protein